MIIEEEAIQAKKTTYGSLYCDKEKESMRKVLQDITPAGKTLNTQSQKAFVTPQEIMAKKIDEKLKEYGWKEVEYEPHLDPDR